MANSFSSNLNIAKPAAGDLNWENEYDDFVEAVDDIGNLLTMNVPVPGNAVDEAVVFDGYTPQEDITVVAIGIFAKTAPTDANLTIDVLKDGAELGDLATLTAASIFEKTTLAAPQDILKTERLGLKIKQIGSTVAGADLIVTIYFKKKAIASST